MTEGNRIDQWSGANDGTPEERALALLRRAHNRAPDQRRTDDELIERYGAEYATMLAVERRAQERRYSRESQARRRAGEPRRQAEVAPCGTRAGRKRHLKAGEEPCDACKAAEAQYARERYQARKAAKG